MRFNLGEVWKSVAAGGGESQRAVVTAVEDDSRRGRLSFENGDEQSFLWTELTQAGQWQVDTSPKPIRSADDLKKMILEKIQRHPVCPTDMSVEIRPTSGSGDWEALAVPPPGQPIAYAECADYISKVARPLRVLYRVRLTPVVADTGVPTGWLNSGDDAADAVVRMTAERHRRSIAATQPTATEPFVPSPPRLTLTFENASAVIQEREIFQYAIADEPESGSDILDFGSIIAQQVIPGSQFAVDTGGRIDLVPDPPGHAPLADGLQREIYQEVRHKALALSSLGHNQLADLSEPIRRFLAATPERIEDVSITRLWSRGNTLRLRLKAHETASALPDHTDPALFPALVAELMRDLVETYNVFMAGDPRGRELDQVRIGPQERDAAVGILGVALQIVAGVRKSEGLATPAAVEALTEQVEAARDAPAGIDGNQAIDLSRKTSSNFVIELLRSAYARVRAEPGVALKEFRFGYYRGLGNLTAVGSVAAAGGAIAFVVTYAEPLKTFVMQAFHNPALTRIIDAIVRASESMPSL
jgi:hypothetical protein